VVGAPGGAGAGAGAVGRVHAAGPAGQWRIEDLDEAADGEVAPVRDEGVQAVRVLLLQASAALRVGVYSHPDCLEHRTPPYHQEAAARIPAILGRLRALDKAAGKATAGAAGLWFTEDFKPAVEAAVRRAHTQEYVGFLNEMEKKVAAVVTQAGAQNVSGRANPRAQNVFLSPKVPLTPAVQRGLRGLQSPDLKAFEDSDTCFTKGSLRAALRAAGAVVAAVDAVLDRRIRAAFCAIRPPGHHAGARPGLAVRSQRRPRDLTPRSAQARTACCPTPCPAVSASSTTSASARCTRCAAARGPYAGWRSSTSTCTTGTAPSPSSAACCRSAGTSPRPLRPAARLILEDRHRCGSARSTSSTPPVREAATLSHRGGGRAPRSRRQWRLRRS
jgi:hypothetical protein